MRELYVYWKAPRASEGRVRAEVPAALTALMQRHPGLQARLLQRADDAGETVTWMEIYRATGGIDTGLQAEIEATLAPLLQQLEAGPRHVEVFVPAD